MKMVQLKEQRMNANVAQYELADALGIDPGTIDDLEHLRIGVAPEYAKEVMATLERLTESQQSPFPKQ